MSMIMRTLFCFALAMYWGTQAHAAVIFAPTLGYLVDSYTDANDTPETKVSSTTTLLDAKLGYLMPGGLYLGAIYGMTNTDGKSGDTATGVSDTRMGASVGFVMGSFHFIGHYLLSGSRTVKSGSNEIKYTEGSGFQFDLGWQFSVASSIGFGPVLTYRNMTFKKRDVAGVKGEKNYTRTDIYPALGFWFMF